MEAKFLKYLINFSILQNLEIYSIQGRKKRNTGLFILIKNKKKWKDIYIYSIKSKIYY